MNLSSVLSRVSGFGLVSSQEGGVEVASPVGKSAGSVQIGGVTVAVGVANDLVEAANDVDREHLKEALLKRLDRLEHRETAALSF